MDVFQKLCVSDRSYVRLLKKTIPIRRFFPRRGCCTIFAHDGWELMCWFVLSVCFRLRLGYGSHLGCCSLGVVFCKPYVVKLCCACLLKKNSLAGQCFPTRGRCVFSRSMRYFRARRLEIDVSFCVSGVCSASSWHVNQRKGTACCSNVIKTAFEL